MPSETVESRGADARVPRDRARSMRKKQCSAFTTLVGWLTAGSFGVTVSCYQEWTYLLRPGRLCPPHKVLHKVIVEFVRPVNCGPLNILGTQHFLQQPVEALVWAWSVPQHKGNKDL